jgi:ribosome assembly protein RRB1
MEAYFVAGSQADKKTDNRIYVMKWSDMRKTVDEDELASDSEEEDEKNRDPVIRFEAVPHRGGINRIRSLHGTPIVATWNEDGEVGIYNVAKAIDALDKPVNK